MSKPTSVYLAWSWPRRIARAVRPTVGLLAIAFALVALSLGLDRLASGSDIGLSADAGATATILASVIGFLAVATLAISISTTLIEAAMGRYGDLVVGALVVDRERDFLLDVIVVAFVVSLANLALLAVGEIRAVAAMAVPIVLSVLSVAVLAGYVRSRIFLFETAHLARHIAATIRDAWWATERPATEYLSTRTELVSAQVETETGRLGLLCFLALNRREPQFEFCVREMVSLRGEHQRRRLNARGRKPGTPVSDHSGNGWFEILVADQMAAIYATEWQASELAIAARAPSHVGEYVNLADRADPLNVYATLGFIRSVLESAVNVIMLDDPDTVRQERIAQVHGLYDDQCRTRLLAFVEHVVSAPPSMASVELELDDRLEPEALADLRDLVSGFSEA